MSQCDCTPVEMSSSPHCFAYKFYKTPMHLRCLHGALCHLSPCSIPETQNSYIWLYFLVDFGLDACMSPQCPLFLEFKIISQLLKDSDLSLSLRSCRWEKALFIKWKDLPKFSMKTDSKIKSAFVCCLHQYEKLHSPLWKKRTPCTILRVGSDLFPNFSASSESDLWGSHS